MRTCTVSALFHYIFIISQLRLTSHPRSTVVLLDTETPGTSREIYSEELVAQWLEHWVCNPGVASSSLTFGIQHCSRASHLHTPVLRNLTITSSLQNLSCLGNYFYKTDKLGKEVLETVRHVTRIVQLSSPN